MNSRTRCTALTAMFLALFAASSSAASITILWDANAESNVSGYIVQYGDRSHVYQTQVDARTAITLKIDNLVEGTTYYFAVQAYSSDGLYSDLSSEVEAYIPVTPTEPKPPSDFTARPGTDGHLTTNTLAWSIVSDAAAYYLYVGTAAGLKDVVNTGETQVLSFAMPVLRSNTPYFARIYTKQGTTWRFADMPFLAPTGGAPSRLLTPPNGQANVITTQVFQWESVTAAQSYYLYVGTSPGAKDVVDSAETLKTSWTPSMPGGRHLYTRLWTKLGGSWFSQDSEFDTAAGTPGNAQSTFTVAPGSDGRLSSSALAWSAVPDATGYYLYVGTAVGLKDVVDTGEIHTTTLTLPTMRSDLPYFARIYTKQGTAWRFTDMSFKVALGASPSQFISPVSGQTGVTSATLFQWQAVTQAEAYYLYVGTTAGARDIVDSRETSRTSWTASSVPAGRHLYARIWTKLAGRWFSQDIEFDSL